MTQEEYEKGFVDYMTKNNGKDYEKCYNKEHIADMKADFLSGAQWRINSVWHKAEDLPKNNKMLIAIDKDERPLLCGPFNKDWKDTVRYFGITIWAYVEDLIPNKEE